MAQASLNPGPGNFVEDALAPQLADGSNITATADGAWTAVDRPGVVAVVLETGTVTGTSVVCDITIQSADDASGTNTVDHGTFTTLTEASDDLERILIAEVWKPYMRYSAVVSGSTPVVPTTINVRDKDYHQALGKTA